MVWTHYAGPERDVPLIITSIQKSMFRGILLSLNAKLDNQKTHISRPYTSLLWGQGWKTSCFEVVTLADIEKYHCMEEKLNVDRGREIEITLISHYIPKKFVFNKEKNNFCFNSGEIRSLLTDNNNNLKYVSRELALVLCIKRGKSDDIADAIAFAMHTDPRQSHLFLEHLQGTRQEINILNLLLTPLSGHDLANQLEGFGYQFTADHVNSLMDLGEWYLWK